MSHEKLLSYSAVFAMFLALFFERIDCFNLDLSAPILKQFKSDANTNFNTYFGYSIAQHITKQEK